MFILILIIICVSVVGWAFTRQKETNEYTVVYTNQNNSPKVSPVQTAKDVYPSPIPSFNRTTSETLPPFKYNINNMLFLYHCDPDEDVYGISPMYWDEIAEDILRANTLLDEAAQKCNAIPQTRIRKEDINFKPSKQFDDDFTRFFYSPFTKTGKISKHPYYIKFSLNGGFSGEKCLFGNIYFTKQNQVGKMWLVSWLNHKCYTINCATKDGQLQVARIDVTTADNYSKTCLYNYNNK